ncbi:MAG: cytochrome c maturation protein CcmE [Cytophagaceae bacterium]|nr:cytochrome c maturation protein CcmE [Cytophagaceae bacterium]MDW8455494.1 cytochrome c maturation protein CcmE [Cytophagaceae bacterium]
MKTSHIIALVVIAVAVAIIFATSSDVSKYCTFSEAEQMSLNGNRDYVHVVGELKKDAHGNITGMYYNPLVDANYFRFILIDSTRREQEVVYRNSKPQNFEASEKVVVVGRFEENVFVAKEIQTKCPSKYEDKEVNI